MNRSLFIAVLVCFAGAATAQARPDAADPKAGSLMPEYRSAFADYRPFREPELAGWREANEEVRQAGGHKGHSSQEPPAADAPAKPAAPEEDRGHR
jgi:hypothetical protein